MFKPVPTRVDYVALEHDVQRWWDDHDIADKYMARNQHANERWSFIDGPITANNPMGVHHAWGRSYKDLYNRFWTMRGRKLRYQNGFDCQGLWIEVEVEKELGFKSKRDIETYGVAEFVEACKERVRRFSGIQTEQSKRLGYWMHWDNSYYTNSDENNYTIWAFLKKVWQKGWLYKGHDTMPWCPRCGTGISQHEIVTEGYQEITHKSVYLKFPLTGSKWANGQMGKAPGFGENESLLVWTTTPWTLAANVAAAVHPELTYEKVRQGDDVLYVSKGARESAIRGEHEVIGEVKGADLVGLGYRGPFDELPVQEGVTHRVIAWEDVSDEEGTGIVHIAPGAGAEDFALSKEYGLDVIAPLDEDGTYLKNGKFGFLEGKFAGDVPEEVFASLREKGLLYRVQEYTHRYPTCWRCASELVFRLVDEWYINMDGALNDGSGKTLREQIQETSNKATWIPEFGKAREFDWLKNMHDWMISKKRYYGLALPIFDCAACGSFEVIGSETELQARAVSGWEQFEGHSPHKPWIDAVTIACATCGETVTRIPDVGNPWLDAGIVPFSTLGYRHDRAYWEAWFPAQFITEAFPGQFRNWFYSLLTMSTALVNRPPFLTVLGHAMVRDEHGEEMHKSKGNAIWFDDAADSMGVDVMRWLFFRQNPANNINFGYGPADEVRRGMFLTLWNTYVFFVTYARIDGWTPAAGSGERSELDRWVRSELHQLIEQVTERLHDFDAAGATRHVERFIDGLSNWYVRRSRRRFWKSESDTDKLAAYATLYECLTTLTRLLAPFVPFLAEAMHQNLVRGFDEAAPESVHLADWPDADAAAIDRRLSEETRLVMRVASLGRAARAKAQIKVRQPVAELFVKLPSALEEQAIERLAPQVLDELNVKALRVVRDEADFLRFEVKPNLKLLGQKYGREVQDIAKALAAMGDRERAEVARRVGAGQAVEVAGKTLAPEEVLVAGREREGFASAEEGGIVVIVSSELTPELVREGTAREIVHRIQNLRKDAGFEIADRIRTYYRAEDGVEAHAALRDVVGAWGDYIRQETLSVDLSDDAPPHGVHSETAEIDGQRVTLAVVRV